MQAKVSISKIGLDVALSCEMMMLMMLLVVRVMMMLMIYITLLIPTPMGALTFFCMVGVPFPNAHDVVMQQVAPHTLTPNP